MYREALSWTKANFLHSKRKNTNTKGLSLQTRSHVTFQLSGWPSQTINFLLGLALLVTYGQPKALALNVVVQVRPTLECAGVPRLTCLLASFLRAWLPKNESVIPRGGLRVFPGFDVACRSLGRTCAPPPPRLPWERNSFEVLFRSRRCKRWRLRLSLNLSWASSSCQSLLLR